MTTTGSVIGDVRRDQNFIKFRLLQESGSEIKIMKTLLSLKFIVFLIETVIPQNQHRDSKQYHNLTFAVK
jgi:hypothetical protein